MFNLPETTHALRLVRCDEKNNRFIYYEGVTFVDRPRATIEMYLRRARVCGDIGPGVESNYTVDLLDGDGDILDELKIERRAARYLVEKLRLRVEQEAQP